MATYLISIPDPCTQNWNEMTPENNGRHCNSCNKVVMDFSGKTNQEILEVLMKNNSVCGRISSRQLNVPIRRFKPVRYTKYHWPSVAAFIVAGMFSLSSAFSQPPSKHKLYGRELAIPKYPENKTNPTQNLEEVPSAKKLLDQTESYFTITGRVILKGHGYGANKDTTMITGVSKAKLHLMRGEKEIGIVETDESGYFSAKIDNKYKNKWIDCSIVAQGTEDKIEYYHFTQTHDPKVPLIIELERRHYLLGAIVTTRESNFVMPGSIGSRIDFEYFADFYFGR